MNQDVALSKPTRPIEHFLFIGAHKVLIIFVVQKYVMTVQGLFQPSW